MKISNFHLAIGIPCNFPFVPTGFFYSYCTMEKPDYTLVHADGGSGAVDTLRNELVAKAFAVNATHLLMLDTDHIFHPKTVTTLISRRLAIVHGICFRRYPPFDSIMLRITDHGYESVDDWTPGELIDVDATGGGCVLYDMTVFREMDRRANAEIAFFNSMRPSEQEIAAMPEKTRDYIVGLEQRCIHPHRPGVYFRFQQYEAATIGEDIGFCQDLKAAGYRIFVDTSVPSDHLTTMAVNEATHRLYRAMKEERYRKNLERALGSNKAI